MEIVIPIGALVLLALLLVRRGRKRPGCPRCE